MRGANDVYTITSATRFGYCRILHNGISINLPSNSGKISKRPLPFAALGFFACLSLFITGCGGITASGRNAEGVRLFQQAQYDQALREFQEASYAETANADSYYNLAATYRRLGKMNNQSGEWEKAETYYNLCLDRNRNHADCYRGLAVLLAEQGRTQEAFRLVEGWVNQQPTSPDAKIELARLNEEFGDRNLAKEHLVEALTLQPDNPRALAALGKIREESGDSAQALANYQRSLWYNSRQPQLASRVSALQSNQNPNIVPMPMTPVVPSVTGSEQTQMVNRDPAPMR
jgi:tetratricopeptide (TPR) repeat protein